MPESTTPDRRDGRSLGPRGLGYGLVAALGSMALTVGCSSDRGIDRPTPLFGDSPVEYPLELWDQDIEGQTLVRVLVNETGAVDSVVVVESSGHMAFDSAAVEGAKGMQFEPALRRGEPVRVWAKVPVHFSKKPRPSGNEDPMLEAGG